MTEAFWSLVASNWMFNRTINNTNNSLALDEWIDASIDKQHDPGNVSGDEWRLGVWNARGVNDSKIGEFRKTIYTNKIDILCVPKTKKKGCKISNTGNCGSALGSENESHDIQGVEFIMNEKVKQRIKKYGRLSSRLFWVRIKVGIRRLFTIACYAPVCGENSEVKDAFGESLNDILAASDPEERIIMIGDMTGIETGKNCFPYT